MLATCIFVHAITPLHAGTGQGVDVIDQPIARERATQLPILPGSSIKGVLRDQYDDDKVVQQELFGPPNEPGSTAEEPKPADFAGALQFSDARLLLLPVRSLAGTFVWATCPFVLKRLVRDLKAASDKPPNGIPGVPAVTEAKWLASSADCTFAIGDQPNLALEDLSAPASSSDTNALAWARWIGTRLFANGDSPWQTELERRLAILDDASFTHLAEYATEVTAHVQINDETGTVDQGKLWYQESLPAETVLIGIVRAIKPRKKNATLTDEAAVLSQLGSFPGLQFGGKSTTGQGFARFLRFNF